MARRLVELKDRALNPNAPPVSPNDPRVVALHGSMPGYPVSKYLHRNYRSRPAGVAGPSWHELEKQKVGSAGQIGDSADFRSKFRELIREFNKAHGSTSAGGGFDFNLWGDEVLRWMGEHGL